MIGAFGNPLLSDSPISDGNTIYQSQADQYGNAFTSPMNSANMNSGWGINSSLLTPSFQAGYRPQYSGPQPTNQYGRRSVAQAAYSLSPFSPDLRWGNPVMHAQQPMEDITSRPADAAMWGAQRIGFPIVAYSLGNATSKALGLGWKAGSRIGASFGGGLAEGFGARAPLNALTGEARGVRDVWNAARVGYAASGFEGAAAAFEGISAGGAANLAFRGIAGTAVGAAASAASGLLIGQAIQWGAQKTIFEPYVNTRKMSRDLRENFAGITFSDAKGNAISGRGIGMQESYRMASQITDQGIRDMTYSTGEYTQGASMIMRSGLTDNVSAGGITKRIKDVMEQVKMIQSIANMPEMREAIAEISKLQNMGASVAGGLSSNAATTYSKLGMFASIAGTSVQRVMNTVGAQGQYLYQANGMTPYMGQLAAAGVYSSLAAGQRMGVMSQATIAKMGGIEGGAQASLTGQINAMQTPFAKIAMFNEAHGGRGFGQGANSVSVISDFNQRMVKDPLGTFGGMELFSGELAGQALTKKGSRAVQDNLATIIAGQPGIMKDGKISFEKAVPYLEQMGMSVDQIKAYYNQLSSEQDPGAYRQGMKAIDAQTSEQYRQYISNNNLYAGGFGSALYRAEKAGRSIMSAGNSAVGSGLEMVGLTGDKLSRGWDKLAYGKTLSIADKTLTSEMMGGARRVASDNVNLFDVKGKDAGIWGIQSSGFHMKDQSVKNDQVMTQINNLARDKDAAGHDEALAYLSSSNSPTKLANLQKVLEFTSYKKDYVGNENSQLKSLGDLNDALNSAGRKATDINKVETKTGHDISLAEYMSKKNPHGVSKEPDDYFSKLSRMSGRVTNSEDREENEKMAGMASELALRYSNPADFAKARAEGTDEDLKQYDAIMTKSLGQTRDTDLYSRIRDAATYSKKYGGTEFNLIMKGHLYGEDGKTELTGEDRIRRALSISGSRFKNGMSNALDVTRDEAINATSVDKSAADTKIDVSQSHMKSGVLDMTGYQQQMMQVEANGLLKKIEENTGKMANKATGTAPTDGGTSDGKTYEWYNRSTWDNYKQDNQKTTQTARGK